MIYKRYLKRAFDLLVSIALLLLTFPILGISCLLLFLSNKGSIFYKQIRPGKDEKFFKIIKLKTMTDDRDATGNLLPDSKRLTKIGAFIRKCSIDELPQLLNVIKGDMSLIGPRPLLPEYLVLYSERQKRRHTVKPGITGWAQVNGRNAIDWNKKFEYDVWYVDNITFLLDLQIITLTIKKVLVRDGINSNSSVTMEKFTGK